jgi:hypothetical protein
LVIDGDTAFVATIEPYLCGAPGRPLTAGLGQ